MADLKKLGLTFNFFSFIVYFCFYLQGAKGYRTAKAVIPGRFHVTSVTVVFSGKRFL